MMGGDSADSARVEAESFTDDRVEHSWDPERRLGELLAKSLDLRGVAWDVYLLYAPGVTWSADGPPTPTFWMHQLPAAAGADQSGLLNAGQFSRELLKLLGKGAEEVAPDLALRLHLKALSAVKRERT